MVVVVVDLEMAWHMGKAYNIEEQNQAVVDRIVVERSLVGDTAQMIVAFDRE